MFSDGNFWDSGLHPLIVVFTLNGMKFTRFSYGDQINAIIFFLRDPNGFTVLRNPSAIAQHIAIQLGIFRFMEEILHTKVFKGCHVVSLGNGPNLLIVFYVQIMPDDFIMQLHRF